LQSTGIVAFVRLRHGLNVEHAATLKKQHFEYFNIGET